MSKLTHLQPQRVFHYFEQICAIPHGSGDTRRISDFCVDFAKEHGLLCEQDTLNNVIIKNPATAGYEDHPAVILQGHLDMDLVTLAVLQKICLPMYSMKQKLPMVNVKRQLFTEHLFPTNLFKYQR